MSEKIESIGIPNEDVPGWMQTLREGGFSDEEIDQMLSHLNQEYARAKMDAYVKSELQRIKDELFQNNKRILTDQELEALRIGIESRFK